LKKLLESEAPEAPNNAFVQKRFLVRPVDTRFPVKIKSTNHPQQSDQAKGPIVNSAIGFGSILGQGPFLKNLEKAEYASNGKAASSTKPGISLVSNPRLDLSLVGLTGQDLTLSSILSCKSSSQVLDNENDKGTTNATKPLRVSHSKLENRQQVWKVSRSNVNQRGSWLKEEEGENKVSFKQDKKASQHASCGDSSQLDRTGSKNAINLIQSRLRRRPYNLLNPLKSTTKPVSSSRENYSDPLKIKLPRVREGVSSATLEPKANKEYNRVAWSRNGESQGQLHMGAKVAAPRLKKWKLASKAN